MAVEFGAAMRAAHAQPPPRTTTYMQRSAIHPCSHPRPKHRSSWTPQPTSGCSQPHTRLAAAVAHLPEVCTSLGSFRLSLATSGCIPMPVAHTQVLNGMDPGAPSRVSTSRRHPGTIGIVSEYVVEQ